MRSSSWVSRERRCSSQSVIREPQLTLGHPMIPEASRAKTVVMSAGYEDPVRPWSAVPRGGGCRRDRPLRRTAGGRPRVRRHQDGRGRLTLGGVAERITGKGERHALDAVLRGRSTSRDRQGVEYARVDIKVPVGHAGASIRSASATTSMRIGSNSLPDNQSRVSSGRWR